MIGNRDLFRILVSVLLFVFTQSIGAQINRGVIEGIVTDPQSAVIPDVQVTITSLDTNVEARTKTNSTGYYRVVDLVPGRYKAHFEVSGFSSLDVRDIEVPAGKVTREDTQLKLGEVTQLLEVTSEAPLLETGPSNFSTTLGTRTVEEIPLAGRDLQQLVNLVPGVVNVSGPPGSNFGFNSQFGTFPDPTNVLGSTLAVNGGQAGANAWYLDGNLNLSSIAENITVNPSPDAVQEFQVITNAFAAEYSRTGGAVFNVVLKSGTNNFHGNIYEFHRNDATNARNPFTSIDSDGRLIKDRQLRFNNFGGTLGGPVILPKLYNGKDKTHFFFSWDTQILRLLGEQRFSVPTARMRGGDFSEDPNAAQHGIWDPFGTVGPDANGLFQRRAFGTPVPGNPFGADGCLASAVESGRSGGFQTCNFATQIPANRLDPTAQYFINSFPLPNSNDPFGGCPSGLDGFTVCNNFLGAVGGEQKPHNISVKFDHQWSQKSKYFFEWLYNPVTYRNYRVPWTGPAYTNVGFGAVVPLNVRNQIYGIGNTYTFSPTLINEFRYSFSRQFLTTTEGTQSYLDEVAAQSEVIDRLAPLQIPVNRFYPTPSFDVSLPVGGGLGFGGAPWQSINEMSEAHTFLDNVTKIAGKHTLKTGLVYRLEHATWASDFPTSLGFYGGVNADPNTGLGGGGGLAQFLLGAVDSSSSTGFYHGTYQRWRYWGAYIQDDIRITPRFSLNVGLRWDLYGWSKTRRADESGFCLDCPNPLTGLIGKIVYRGDPEFPGPDLYPANKKNFGPRFNFSWAPFQDQKTVIRGGYNIFTSNAANGINSPNQFQSPGWQLGTYWGGSFSPEQCAPFSFQCVAFPLSDTTTDKASLATPPLTATTPALNHDPLLGGGANFMERPSRDPFVQMWSLEVEREVPGDIVLTLGYVGNHGTHLFGETFRNYSYVPTAVRQQFRTGISANIPITDVYSGQTAAKFEEVYGGPTLPRSLLLRNYPFHSVSTPKFDGTSIYHGLNLRVQKRFSHGLHFLAAYTASKKITNASTIILAQAIVNPVSATRSAGVGGRAGALGLRFNGDYYEDRDNRRDRIIAFDDIPQMFNLAVAYELPFGKGKPYLNQGGILNVLFGGWKLATNFNTQSGLPLAITCPGNALSARCNLIGDPKFQGSRSKEERIRQWINPGAFEPPFGSDESFWNNYDPNDDRAYVFGNAGARLPSIRSPGFWNSDMALSKRFPISESKYFEFRWEAFNAFNHQNLGLPDTSFCLPPGADGSQNSVRYEGCSFGRITNVQTDPRSMQFALKVFF